MARIDNVIILHGYGVRPTSMWFPWLHQALEAQNLRVWVPALPDALRPNYEKWMGAVSRQAKSWTGSTLLIGHSLGGVLAMRLLEKAAAHRIAGTILVSPPFASTIRVEPLTHFFDRPIDWEKVRSRSAAFSVIHAKDDPLVPFDHALRYKEMLHAKLKLHEKGGHFTGKKAPAVLKAAEVLMK